jgi:hypothetical protein
MRLSSSTVRCASYALLAALVAGCSNSPQGTQQTLPLGSSVTNGLSRVTGASSGVAESAATHRIDPADLKGPIKPAKLLRLQLAGKLPAPVPLRVLRYEIKQLRGHVRPHFTVHPAQNTVGLWGSNNLQSAILGQSMNARRTIMTIDANANDCDLPSGLKVDHSQTLWAACEDDPSGSGERVQSYTNSGSLIATYATRCPTNEPSCTNFFAFGFDAATDSTGHVFASILGYSCSPGCSVTNGSGFEYWPVGSPSSAPTIISLGSQCLPVCSVGFMDVDTSGNLWFNYFGFGIGVIGWGVGEVTDPTGTPTFLPILSPGTFLDTGGVYVSGGGTTLNVTDETARTTSQYSLPLGPGGTPFNVSGPTLDPFGFGAPVSGGFNQNGRLLALGDGEGWVNIGRISANAWRGIGNPNFVTGLLGVAYTPSDK